MAAEVFISYASQNRDRILDLVERLRGAGVSVWIDQMGIEGAAMWSQQIVAAIRDCKVLILAISKNSATSENVVKELALASEGRKRILPVFIEEADIPETMAYQLAGIQRVEFFEGNEEVGLKAVIRALATLDVDVCSDATAAAGATAAATFSGVARNWWRVPLFDLSSSCVLYPSRSNQSFFFPAGTRRGGRRSPNFASANAPSVSSAPQRKPMLTKTESSDAVAASTPYSKISCGSTAPAENHVPSPSQTTITSSVSARQRPAASAGCGSGSFGALSSTGMATKSGLRARRRHRLRSCSRNHARRS